MTDDLTTFTRGAIDQAYGLAEDDIEDPIEGEGEEAEEADGQIDEATASAFWESLTPEQYANAEADEEFRAELWEAFLEDQAEDGDDVDEDEAPWSPGSGLDIVRAALEAEAAGDLVTADGDRLTAVAWLRWATTASDREWIAAARAAGWDPSVRPSPGDVRAFGRGLEGAVAAEDWQALLAKRRRSGRYLGSS